MDEYLLANAKHYLPRIFDEAKNMRQGNDQFELIFEMEDGSLYIYDDLNNSVRHISYDCNNMTEEECRFEFGMRLHRLMARRGISQEKLSELTGISRLQISKYITGRNTPNFYNVDKIAKALGCSTDELRYIRN